ncbi:unnamed protein product [Didymodactylos carnosus]|uniref:tryptophan--tRNA ligase n=1 Tax=Didymodactylos carnosus TaxID=1234261 RepID=A0A814WE55_9BILA|nr:unnamed protein product [Didymodactylos carnosus]CAF1201048.1 unnamed protein product [Didymodactylos carnosus]CAF3774926.1 unnamed protein product [Didymodactylos carnosus]CAF3965516.1 unnamed protein product [Didymodactylos carnosus]
MFSRRILAGIQPSNVPHLGNYLGAIKRWVELQNSGEHLIVMLADLHAVTLPRDPKILRQTILETTSSLLACGINPDKSIIYRQSQLPHHTTLAWLMGTLATVQQISHIPTYKSKVKDEESIPLGLFMYPILQSADILLFKSTHIPVGEDQLPHLHLCTTLIEKFYHIYKKELFPMPKPMFTETNRIRSLRHPENKMSKSDADPRGRIDIMDTEDLIRDRVMKAVTDFESRITYDPENRPGVSNLIDIFSGLTGEMQEDIVERAQLEGLNTKEFKEKLIKIIIEHFKPFRIKYLELMNDHSYIYDVLQQGQAKAAVIADQTLNEVKQTMGLD